MCASDGKTARGRWHLFAQLAQHGKFHEWSTGIYENEYRNEGGLWKISRLHLYPTMVTPYETGWGKESLPASRFEPALKPDAPSSQSSTYDRDVHAAVPLQPPGARRAPALSAGRPGVHRSMHGSLPAP